jgi:hypothetical protein
MFEGGTNTYNNWVEVSAGDLLPAETRRSSGNNSRSRAMYLAASRDLHYQASDQRDQPDGGWPGLFDEDDYQLKFSVAKEKLGYLRFSYNEFQTWYNGDRGYFSPSQSYYGLPGNGWRWIGGSPLTGLRMEKVPSLTFKYTHATRRGQGVHHLGARAPGQ